MRPNTPPVTGQPSLAFHALLRHRVAVTLLLVSLATSGAAPLPPAYAEGELLVKFKGGPRGAAAAQAQRSFQHKVKRHFDPIGWQHIQLPPGQTVAEALPRYQRHSDVLDVEPNYRLPLMAMCTDAGPNDPMFSQQWGLLQIGATNAWATTTGSSNVVVAVIDSGIDYLHEDLAANMWRNRGEIPGNGKDDDANGYVDDVYGIDVVSHDGNPMEGWWSVWTHGTACAGIIGAVGNNGLGIAGVNWSAQLMAVRFLANSSSNYVYTAGFVEACCYVLDMKSRGVNIRVTSNSYGFTGMPPEVVRTALESLGHAGILSVFAAGRTADGGTNLDVAPIAFPQYWHLPGTLNVAASDASDTLTFDSNWGATNVDLAAPGVGIVTTQGGPPHTLYYDANGSVRGTSVACPYVAGAAALLAAAYPFATSEQIKTALLESVDVVPALSNRMVSNGRLNVGRAIHHPILASNAPPFITRHPQSQTNGPGNCATFFVTATGTSLSYQWRVNGTNLADSDRIRGATSNTLTLCHVQTSDAADYTVVVTNVFDAATSAAARLTVVICPVILVQPRSQLVLDGTNVVLCVVAAGMTNLLYQWQRNSADIPNATNAILTLTNVIPSDSDRYQVRVSNACGAVLSTNAEVTVLGWPRIIAPLRNPTVAVGSDVPLSLDVAHTATLPIYADWYLDSSYLDQTVHDDFTVATNIPNIQPNLAGTWEVYLANTATFLFGTQIASDSAYVTVVERPTNVTVMAGNNVSFTARAYGTLPIGYQWQFDGTNMSRATTTTLTLSNVQPRDAGTYTLVVTNAAGEPTSFLVYLDVLTSCQELTVRLVPCAQSPSGWCVHLCWPDLVPACLPQWTDNLSRSLPWSSWTGPSTVVAGCKCADIPVTGNMMFFRIGCAP